MLPSPQAAEGEEVNGCEPAAEGVQANPWAQGPEHEKAGTFNAEAELAKKQRELDAKVTEAEELRSQLQAQDEALVTAEARLDAAKARCKSLEKALDDAWSQPTRLEPDQVIWERLPKTAMWTVWALPWPAGRGILPPRSLLNVGLADGRAGSPGGGSPGKDHRGGTPSGPARAVSGAAEGHGGGGRCPGESIAWPAPALAQLERRAGPGGGAGIGLRTLGTRPWPMEH